MDYKQELNQITEIVDKQKTEQIKLEERKRQLTEDKTKILNELKELDIAEEKLTETIEELEINIQKQVSIAQQLLK